MPRKFTRTRWETQRRNRGCSSSDRTKSFKTSSPQISSHSHYCKTTQLSSNPDNMSIKLHLAWPKHGLPLITTRHHADEQQLIHLVKLPVTQQIEEEGDQGEAFPGRHIWAQGWTHKNLVVKGQHSRSLWPHKAHLRQKRKLVKFVASSCSISICFILVEILHCCQFNKNISIRNSGDPKLRLGRGTRC